MLRYANALFAIIILISCTVAEAGRGGFLFICIGDCAWWEYLLMALSVIIFSCCCWLCRQAVWVRPCSRKCWDCDVEDGMPISGENIENGMRTTETTTGVENAGLTQVKKKL